MCTDVCGGGFEAGKSAFSCQLSAFRKTYTNATFTRNARRGGTYAHAIGAQTCWISANNFFNESYTRRINKSGHGAHGISPLKKQNYIRENPCDPWPIF